MLISSVIIKINSDYKLADPICTILFSVIVFCTTINVVRDSVRILMEGCPRAINYNDVAADLANLLDVVLVHDLRIWKGSRTCWDSSNQSFRIKVAPFRKSYKKNSIVFGVFSFLDLETWSDKDWCNVSEHFSTSSSIPLGP